MGTLCEVEFPRLGCQCPQCKEARNLGDDYFHRYHSSLLIEENKKKIVIDVGKNLNKKIKEVNPDYVLLTHNHPDHIGGVNSLDVKVPIYLTQVIANKAKKYFKTGRYLKIIRPNVPFRIEGIKFIAHRVYHSSLAPTVCYKIADKYLYAPDCLRFYNEKILEGIECWICDGSSLERDIRQVGNVGHSSIKNEINLAKKYSIPNLIITHIGHHRMKEVEFRKRIEDMGNQYKIFIEVADNKDNSKLIEEIYTRQRRKINSPTFAYLTVWKKMPDKFLRGRTDEPKKDWHGLQVDKALKDSWLDKLNNIKGIEVRSSDAGKSAERPAFIVIRFSDKQNDNKAKVLVDKLSKEDGIYCKTDIGMEGRPRICVAGKVWQSKDKKEWESWWDSLAGKIEKCIEGILSGIKEVKTKNLNDFKGNILGKREKIARTTSLKKLILKGKSDSEPLDDEFVPYLKKINNFSFIATTQSCCGHGGDKDRKAYLDFRSGLSEKDTIDFLLRPMQEKFDPDITTELSMECNRLRYCLWLDNNKWEKQIEYFIELLSKVPEDKIEMKEFEAEAMLEEAKHRRDKCMKCNNPPVYEILWAEGMGHAWFCKKCFKEWATKGDGRGEIISVKEIKNGEASKKFRDNTNPNIWEKIKGQYESVNLREFKLKDYQVTEVRDDQLRDDYRLILAKISTMIDGGRTEFETLDDAKKFLKKVVRELLKRKCITFHPDKMKPRSLRVLKEVLKELKKEGIKLSDEVEKIIESVQDTIKSIKDRKDFTIIPDYVSLVGSSVEGKEKPEDVDILIRQKNRWESLEIRLAEQFKEPKNLHWIYAPEGPHDDYQPLYDLQLVRSKQGKRVIESLQQKIKLDLGCGENKAKGYFGIDRQSFSGVDLIWDLENGIPFESDSADEIRAYHFLEHISNPIMIMNEIWRVLKPGGILEFEVPSMKGEGAVADPTHRSKWNKLSFQFYVDDQLRKTHSIYPKFKIIELEEYENRKWDTVYVKGKLEAIKNITKEGIIETKIEEAVKTLKPLVKFTPLKMGRGYTREEFFDIKDFWDKWAKAYIDRGLKLDLEEKLNGYRTIFEADDKGNTLIYFEDTKKDKSQIFPEIINDLKIIGEGVILDGDVGAIGIDGKVLPRKELAFLTSRKEPIKGEFENPAGTKGKLRITIFDLLYWKGEDLHTKPWIERRKLLEELFGKYDFKILKLVKKHIVDSKSEFVSTGKRLSKVDGSEGFVAKVVTSDYPLTGQTPAWSKFKSALEIKVQVLNKFSVKGAKAYNYEIGYLIGNEVISAGKTYNTKINAKIGDILTLTVQEIIPKEKDGKWYVNFVVPGVVDLETQRTKPETNKEIINRAEKAGILQITPEVRNKLKKAKLIESFTEDWRTEYIIEEAKDEGKAGEFGNIDFKEGDTGTGVAQIHIMGLTEDGMKKIKANSKRIMAARNQGLKAFASTMKSIIKAGAHIDIRMRPSGANYWEGLEIFIGNVKGLDKLANYKTGDVLRCQFKQSRKEERKISIVRGGLTWLDLGKNKVKIFNPGEAGAFANTWAALITFDIFRWIAGRQDKHFKEFKFSFIRNKQLDGRWIMTFVPIDSKRIWMMRMTKQTELDSEIEKKKD